MKKVEIKYQCFVDEKPLNKLTKEVEHKTNGHLSVKQFLMIALTRHIECILEDPGAVKSESILIQEIN